MSEEDEKEGGNSPPDVIAEDAEVCCQLDQEELLIRVRYVLGVEVPYKHSMKYTLRYLVMCSPFLLL